MATIRLTWPANPASELVDGYEVWQSTNGGSSQPLTVVSTNQLDIPNPVPAAYAWTVRAHNLVGYGPQSPVTAGPSLPSTPGSITVTVV